MPEQITPELTDMVPWLAYASFRSRFMCTEGKGNN